MPDTGEGVNAGAFANDSSRVEDRIAADFDMIAKHGSHFLQAGLDLFVFIFDDDQCLIAFDIGGDGSSPHMGAIAQNAVAYIVVMGDLDVIKEDDVFQFG